MMNIQRVVYLHEFSDDNALHFDEHMS
jgi:hypothetical protein